MALYAALDRDQLVATCEAAVQQYEAAQSRSDLVTAGLTCGVAVAASAGSVASVMFNSSINGEAAAAAWQAVTVNPSLTQGQIEAVYIAANNNTDDGLATEVVQSIAANAAAVDEISTTVALKVGEAFSAVQYFFASEGNFLSYGYQAVASCVGEFTHSNRERMEHVVFDNVMDAAEAADPFLTSNKYGISTYSANATTTTRALVAQVCHTVFMCLCVFDKARGAGAKKNQQTTSIA